jgi:hypothetical protein
MTDTPAARRSWASANTLLIAEAFARNGRIDSPDDPAAAVVHGPLAEGDEDRLASLLMIDLVFLRKVTYAAARSWNGG